MLKKLIIYVFTLLLILSFYVYSKSKYDFIELNDYEVSNDWNNLDESIVFFKRFKHRQYNNNWSIKIGKGGQIYSIKLPHIGEIIASQRKNHGQWVDEVFQHIISFPPQKSRSNRVVDGDIHQAGYYIQSDITHKKLINQSIYSPMFNYNFNKIDKSFSFDIWPQHAHLPRKYDENLVLLYQKISDIGDGVIEITVEFSKWGGEPYQRFNLPFSAFRTAKLPILIENTVDDEYNYLQTSAFKNSIPIYLRDRNTQYGWFALISSLSNSANGISIIYGKFNGDTRSKSYIRFGTYETRGVKKHTNTVFTVSKDINLEKGYILTYKYFIVLGKKGHIIRKSNEFMKYVSLSKYKLRSNQIHYRNNVCIKNNKLSIDCTHSDNYIFNTFSRMAYKSDPLFILLNNKTNETILTNDPYEISFDPTDGYTTYLEFIGWTVPYHERYNTNSIQLSEVISNYPNLNIILSHNITNLYVLRK